MGTTKIAQKVTQMYRGNPLFDQFEKAVSDLKLAECHLNESHVCVTCAFADSRYSIQW